VPTYINQEQRFTI